MRPFRLSASLLANLPYIHKANIGNGYGEDRSGLGEGEVTWRG